MFYLISFCNLDKCLTFLGSYIPEGLMTSCTWDYVTYTLANRSYTMMLCCFVFFIPLGIIFYCYLLMFLAIRKTSRYCDYVLCTLYAAHAQLVYDICISLNSPHILQGGGAFGHPGEEIHPPAAEVHQE